MIHSNFSTKRITFFAGYSILVVLIGCVEQNLSFGDAFVVNNRSSSQNTLSSLRLLQLSKDGFIKKSRSQMQNKNINAPRNIQNKLKSSTLHLLSSSDSTEDTTNIKVNPSLRVRMRILMVAAIVSNRVGRTKKLVTTLVPRVSNFIPSSLSIKRIDIRSIMPTTKTTSKNKKVRKKTSLQAASTAIATAAAASLSSILPNQAEDISSISSISPKDIIDNSINAAVTATADLAAATVNVANAAANAATAAASTTISSIIPNRPQESEDHTLSTERMETSITINAISADVLPAVDSIIKTTTTATIATIAPTPTITPELVQSKDLIAEPISRTVSTTSTATTSAETSEISVVNTDANDEIATTLALPKGNRWEICHPTTNLSGKWAVVVTPELKKEYDLFLQAFKQPAFFRSVALNVLSMTKETLSQNDDGTEFTISGTNPKGVWTRTLHSSGTNVDSNDEGLLFEPKFIQIKNAGGGDVEAESWWEEDGTVHASWVRKAKEGDFLSRRYLDEEGFYICESSYFPKEKSSSKNVVKEPAATMTWKFRKEE